MKRYKNKITNRKSLMGKLRIYPYNQHSKKDVDLSLGKHLETRSKTGEENLQRVMPVEVDNHYADTYRTGLQRFMERYPDYPIEVLDAETIRLKELFGRGTHWDMDEK